MRLFFSRKTSFIILQLSLSHQLPFIYKLLPIVIFQTSLNDLSVTSFVIISTVALAPKTLSLLSPKASHRGRQQNREEMNFHNKITKHQII